MLRDQLKSRNAEVTTLRALLQQQWRAEGQIPVAPQPVHGAPHVLRAPNLLGGAVRPTPLGAPAQRKVPPLPSGDSACGGDMDGSNRGGDGGGLGDGVVTVSLPAAAGPQEAC